MRKNWLAAAWTRWFRAAPLVPDAAFQDTTEPYPGHWRRFPSPWLGTPAQTAARVAALDAALSSLPELWRRVVLAGSGAHGEDQSVAEEFGLTVEQVRDIRAHARAAVRDRLDGMRRDGPE